MESLSDVELGRVADATAWRSGRAKQFIDEHYFGDAPGCLVCHATGNKYDAAEGILDEKSPIVLAEMRYMRYACRHSEPEAGRLMASMARAILARRAIQAMPSLPVASVQPETHVHA
jgi:hypothetical protein